MALPSNELWSGNMLNDSFPTTSLLTLCFIPYLSTALSTCSYISIFYLLFQVFFSFFSPEFIACVLSQLMYQEIFIMEWWKWALFQTQTDNKLQMQVASFSPLSSWGCAVRLNTSVSLLTLNLYHSLLHSKCSPLPVSTRWTARVRSPRWVTRTSSSWSTTSRR